MDWQKIALFVVIVLAITAAWLGRYELRSNGSGNSVSAYRLDRWTGDVVFIAIDQASKVKEEK